jgi:hypothetical protein
MLAGNGGYPAAGADSCVADVHIVDRSILCVTPFTGMACWPGGWLDDDTAGNTHNSSSCCWWGHTAVQAAAGGTVSSSSGGVAGGDEGWFTGSTGAAVAGDWEDAHKHCSSALLQQSYLCACQHHSSYRSAAGVEAQLHLCGASCRPGGCTRPCARPWQLLLQRQGCMGGLFLPVLLVDSWSIQQPSQCCGCPGAATTNAQCDRPCLRRLDQTDTCTSLPPYQCWLHTHLLWGLGRIFIAYNPGQPMSQHLLLCACKLNLSGLTQASVQ